jgi:hypothetical protein
LREFGQNAAYQWSGVRVVLVFYLTGASILILDISIQYLMTGLVCAKNEVQWRPSHDPSVSLLFRKQLRVICDARGVCLFGLSGEGLASN